MINNAGNYPDIKIFPDMTARAWEVEIMRNGMPWAIGDSLFVCRLFNAETEIGTLPLTHVHETNAVFKISVGLPLINELPRYSTWRLYEDREYDTVLVQGRLIKQR